MHAACRVAENFNGQAGEPLQEIDCVDGLVDEGPAAVEGEGAFPTGVISRRAVPFDVGAGRNEPAKTATIERRFQGPRTFAEAGLDSVRRERLLRRQPPEFGRRERS